jgi:hypothetical protein
MCVPRDDTRAASAASTCDAVDKSSYERVAVDVEGDPNPWTFPATVGLFRTSEQSQKRGPPDAVLPDQADPMAW